MELPERAGIVNRRCKRSVDETVERLRATLRDKGITIFALIDHSGEAAKVAMKLRPTKLLIFGSPKSGTPLMVASPSIALDFPLKLLVWEDDGGTVWISFNSVDYLRQRHQLPEELTANIAIVSALAEKAAQ
jgi:uncharacterized protein (DUF302 family)